MTRPNAFRLCYIHNILMPGAQANTVHVAKMCSAFAANGCDVTLIAVAAPNHQSFATHLREHYGLKHNFTAIPLPGLAAKPSLAALYGATHARLAGANLVYTRAPHVGLAACSLGLPVIFEIHTDESAFSSVGRLALHKLIAHPRLLGVVAISAALAEHLRALFPTARIVVAHDGADIHAPANHAERTKERLRVGYVGHLYRGKGIDLIAELARLCPWADFDVIGGTEADLARWRAADASQNLRFLGAIPHAEVVSRLAGFDVMLAPYQRTVFAADGRTDTARWMSPLKLFEYMAVGAPIIASDLPAIREILADGSTALLVDPEQPDAWAVALMRLYRDQTYRAGIGAAARAHFLKHFTWEQRAAHILSAFELQKPAAHAA